MSSKKTSLVILMLIAITISGCQPSPGPSDAVVKKSFNLHRVEFDRLRKLIEEDANVVRVGRDVIGDCWFGSSETTFEDALRQNGMTEQRYRRYEELFDIVGAYRVTIDSDEGIEIGMHRDGTIPESYSVEIVFPKTAPTTTSHDSISATKDDNTVAFYGLEDGWFIKREHN